MCLGWAGFVSSRRGLDEERGGARQPCVWFFMHRRPREIWTEDSGRWQAGRQVAVRALQAEFRFPPEPQSLGEQGSRCERVDKTGPEDELSSSGVSAVRPGLPPELHAREETKQYKQVPCEDALWASNVHRSFSN